MAVYLYGNIDGNIYQPRHINVFEMAKKQDNQPVPLKETGTGQNIQGVKVTLSKEGLRALHGTQLKGSIDPREVQKQMAYLSEHQPIESFTNRFSRILLSSYENQGEALYAGHSVQEKADTLLNGFRSIYEEVVGGYEEGTRIRYIEDELSEDGFRKLTKEEELEILQREFNDFVDFRFGEKRQKQSEEAVATVNAFQKVKKQMGYGEAQIYHYKPEVIPKGFAEQVKRAAKEWMEQSAFGEAGI